MQDEDCSHNSGCKKGRPRSEAVRLAILRAANDLLARDGFAAVTMEAIAGAAGVSKATLYRWWPGKAAVVMDAFLAATAPCLPFPDTGEIGEDLRQQLCALAYAFSGPFGTIMAGVIAEAQADPEAAEAFRSRYLAPRRREALKVLERGRERGEICPTADLDTVIDALYGPVYYRLLAGHAPLTPCFADTLVALVLGGLQAVPKK